MPVVDGFEAVQIDERHQHCKALALADGEHAAQFLRQMAAVGQAGQGVVGGFERQLAVEFDEFFDQRLAFDLLRDQAGKEGQHARGHRVQLDRLGAGGAQGAVERAIGQAHRRAQVGADAQRLRRLRIAPAVAHIGREKALAV